MLLRVIDVPNHCWVTYGWLFFDHILILAILVPHIKYVVLHQISLGVALSLYSTIVVFRIFCSKYGICFI